MSRTVKFSVSAVWIAALAVFFFVSSSSSAAGVSMSESAEGGSASPASIYASHCAACHGANGRAQTAKGRKLDATDLTGDWNRDTGRTIRIITNGKGDMPSFKRRLSDADIRAVAGYVQHFHR